jgi:hypothetical protein
VPLMLASLAWRVPVLRKWMKVAGLAVAGAVAGVVLLTALIVQAIF